MTEIWVRKLDSFAAEAAADRDFWSRVAPDERVAVVEELRQTWFKMKGIREQGLRRVVRVLEPPRG